MKRALLIVLDSLGIGHAPDAAEFGDQGANTLGHIRETVPGFSIPNLDGAGLAHAEALAAGNPVPNTVTQMGWGCLTEQSVGKDTTSGHWEMAGAPVRHALATFERFPGDLVKRMEQASGVAFIGNYAQSGTVILEELGAEHLTTGKPILYTSADSVIQIAAHEDIVPLETLYEICKACRIIADRERIGRVIARPFRGEPGNFVRTAGRHDFSMNPPRILLNALENQRIRTIGIGKISDIFAGSGMADSFPTSSNADGMNRITELWKKPIDQATLYFANLVDFDMLYGHRRDPEGYAAALEQFDQWLESLFPLERDSLVMITADHGNDPTWTGTDHTRERVPILVSSFPGQNACLGVRESFSDIAASLGTWFGVSTKSLEGSTFLNP